MEEYEEKFVVINLKHIKRMPDKVKNDFNTALMAVSKLTPDNKYYVCNQDEPYAKEIINIILEGETKKEVDEAHDLSEYKRLKNKYE